MYGAEGEKPKARHEAKGGKVDEAKNIYEHHKRWCATPK